MSSLLAVTLLMIPAMGLSAPDVAAITALLPPHAVIGTVSIGTDPELDSTGRVQRYRSFIEMPTIYASQFSTASSTQWLVCYTIPPEATDPPASMLRQAVVAVEEHGHSLRLLATVSIDEEIGYMKCCALTTTAYEFRKPVRMTVITVADSARGLGADIQVVGWDGRKFHKLFRPYDANRALRYVLLPSSGSSSLVIEARGLDYRMGGPSDVYVVTPTGARFANSEYPGLYRRYLRDAENWDSGSAVPHDRIILIHGLRALISLRKYELCLRISQKILDGIQPDELAARWKAAGISRESGYMSMHRLRGDVFTAQGNEKSAVSEYTLVYGWDKLNRGSRLKSRYLQNLPADRRREYDSDPEKRAVIDAEIQRRMKELGPGEGAKAAGWEFLGDEYMHRCLFAKARAAYAVAVQRFSEFDETFITYSLEGSNLPNDAQHREEFRTHYPGGLDTDRVKVKIARVAGYEPD